MKYLCDAIPRRASSHICMKQKPGLCFPIFASVIAVTACSRSFHDHGTMDRRPRSRVLAWMVLLSLSADLLLKSSADMQEVMWACYWASVSVTAGIFLNSDKLVSWGVVFFAGLGLPAWLLGILIYGQVEITSVLIHTIPLIAGLYYMSGMTALPKHSAVGAWLLYSAPFVLAWRFCDPDAMINLSHWARSPLPSVLPHVWQFYVALMTVSAVMVTAAASMMNYILVRRAGPDRSTSGTASRSNAA
jgi:hypothetical protein